MGWIVYNTTTKGIISYSENEPSVGPGESKEDITLDLSSVQHLYKLAWISGSIERNTSLYVSYRNSDGVVQGFSANEPASATGYSFIITDYRFNFNILPSEYKIISGQVEMNENAKEDEPVTGDSYYVWFNYARSTSSSKVLYTGKSTASSNKDGRYDQNNVIPNLIPFNAAIDQVGLVMAGAAVSGSTVDDEVDLNIELVNANASGSKDVIDNLKIPIDTSKYNIGRRYNRNTDLDIREVYDIDPVRLPINTMLSGEFKRVTGISDIAAIRNMYVWFRIINLDS